MIKARFLEQQPSVKVSEVKDKYYIFICLNEEKEKQDGQNMDSIVYNYVYDYTEIVINKDEIDIDDLKINPDKYINYNEITILNDLKIQKINESKIKLEEYLVSHPLHSTAKYNDGRYYNVTAEKQRQLTSKIAMYSLYQQQSLPYSLLKWNDTGDVCEDWTIEQLTQLAMEIDEYVTPLVEKQQTYEKNIQKAMSVDEVRNIVLSFDD